MASSSTKPTRWCKSSLSLTSLTAGLTVDLSLSLRYIASLTSVSDSRSLRSVSVTALSPSLLYRALSQANRWNSTRSQSVPAPKRTRSSTNSCLNYADSAKHCRMELLMQQSVSTAGSALEHMKRTHEAVNEKESKHISAAVSLISSTN
ncbi:uncharacterized protein LOC110265285 [Arachis ipaensis]|uniref:uncharacterized protein LOC110265285 n=1 Tax=Arachis ipaensis TaxID=130454 RepID=UPI000A2B245C|nr:uncharacterized protein LOC110265285 [Arachis ipaensis]